MGKYTSERNYKNVKPVEYMGIQFKSTLEARWAAFFQLMKQKWTYEPDVIYENNIPIYAPDFWLENGNCYIEVKPSYPTQSELSKAEACVRATGKDLFFLYGEIDVTGCVVRPIGNEVIGVFVVESAGYTDPWISVGDHEEKFLSYCPACNTLRPSLHGATEKIGLTRNQYEKCCPSNPGDSLGGGDDNGKMRQAAMTALSMSFDPIERPKPVKSVVDQVMKQLNSRVKHRMNNATETP